MEIKKLPLLIVGIIGAENPADLLSSGADVSELLYSSVWMNGPK